MSTHILKDKDGKPAFAVVPWDEYERMRNAGSEEALLIAAGNAARDEEAFPADVAKRLVSGEHPLKVFREWRKMTQASLSKRAGVATQYISQIERGQRNMGPSTAEKLARRLGVSVDALMI